MPYAIDYDERGFVTFSYSGIISPQAAEESSVEGIARATKHGVQLFLADHTESLVVLPVEQVFDLMDRLARRTHVSRNARLAIVLPPGSGQVRRDLEYFETVAMNQGWQVSVFDSRREAIDWLTG